MEKVLIGGVSRRSSSRSRFDGPDGKRADGPDGKRADGPDGKRDDGPDASIQEKIRQRIEASRKARTERAEAAKKKVRDARKAESLSATTAQRVKAVKQQEAAKEQQIKIKARDMVKAAVAAKKRAPPKNKVVTKKIRNADAVARDAAIKIAATRKRREEAVKAKESAEAAQRQAKADLAKQEATKKLKERLRRNRDRQVETGRGGAEGDLTKGSDKAADATHRQDAANSTNTAALRAADGHKTSLDPISKPSNTAVADGVVSRAANKRGVLQRERDALNSNVKDSQNNAADPTAGTGNATTASARVADARAEATKTSDAFRRRQADLDSVAGTSRAARKNGDDAGNAAKDANDAGNAAKDKSKTPEPDAPTPPKTRGPPITDPAVAGAKRDANSRDIDSNISTRADLQKQRDDAVAAAAAARPPKDPGLTKARDDADKAAAAARVADASHKDSVDAANRAALTRDTTKADLEKTGAPDPTAVKAHKDDAAALTNKLRDAKARADNNGLQRDKSKDDANRLRDGDGPPPKRRLDDDEAARLRKKKEDEERERARKQKEEDDKKREQEENRKKADEAAARMRDRGNRAANLLSGFPFPLIAILGGLFAMVALTATWPTQKFPSNIFGAPRPSGVDPYANGKYDGSKDGYAEGFVNGTSDGSGKKGITDTGLRDPIKILELIAAEMKNKALEAEQDAFCGMKRVLVTAASIALSDSYPGCVAAGGGPSGTSGPSGPLGYSQGYREGFLKQYPNGYSAGVVMAEAISGRGPRDISGSLAPGYGAYGPYGASGASGSSPAQKGGEGPGHRVEQRPGTRIEIEEVDENLSEALLTPKDFLYLIKKSGRPNTELRFIERYMSSKLRQRSQEIKGS